MGVDQHLKNNLPEKGNSNEDVLTSSNKEGIERVKESKGGEKQMPKLKTTVNV